MSCKLPKLMTGIAMGALACSSGPVPADSTTSPLPGRAVSVPRAAPVPVGPYVAPSHTLAEAYQAQAEIAYRDEELEFLGRRSALVMVAAVRDATAIRASLPGETALEDMRLVRLEPVNVIRGSAPLRPVLAHESGSREAFRVGTTALFFLSPRGEEWFIEGSFALRGDQIPELKLTVVDVVRRAQR